MIQKIKTWREIRRLKQEYWRAHDMMWYARIMEAHGSRDFYRAQRERIRESIVALGGKV